MIEGETTFEIATTEYVKITRKLREAHEEFDEEFEELRRREKETTRWYEEVIRKHLELSEDVPINTTIKGRIIIGLNPHYSPCEPTRILDNDLFQRLKQLPSEFDVYFNYYDGQLNYNRFEICLQLKEMGEEE